MALDQTEWKDDLLRFNNPTPDSLAWSLDGLIIESEICLVMESFLFSCKFSNIVGAQQNLIQQG